MFIHNRFLEGVDESGTTSLWTHGERENDRQFYYEMYGVEIDGCMYSTSYMSNEI